jgi:hypothetical protein
MISLPPPVFLGFIAKKIHPVKPEAWGGAEEVCSVSRCIAPYPDGWDDNPFDPPEFNRAYCLATADDARKRIRNADVESSRIYAIQLIPAIFTNESPTPSIYPVEELFAQHGDLPELPAEPDWDAFERLGFDVTVFGPPDSPTWGWSCSPLSCNGMHQAHRVNRYCLIDEPEDAVKAAQSFAETEPEPGPYVIVEVFREAAR